MKTFFKRTFSTVILLSAFLTAIFGPDNIRQYVFGVLVILLSYFSVKEFTTILKSSGNPANTIVTPVFTALTAILALLNKQDFCLGIAAVFIIHQWAMFLTSKNEEKAMRSILNSTAGYFLFAIPIVFMIGIYNRDPLIFLYFVLVTKVSDIGAYVVGTITNALSKGGNHKMIPSISPGKSYEGAVGGILSAIGLSYLLCYLCKFDMPVWFPPVSGFVLFFGSMAGDLAESAFKRTCQVKDSGHVIPGIGGVFDLVDSLLINALLFSLFLYFA
ncbi:MAG: phosphatidate cytidylyltransferase [Lentisphaeria bacterium]|nr:phosphatidate cytidylyltransferase [Lentisphaeria bacterium]